MGARGIARSGVGEATEEGECVTYDNSKFQFYNIIKFRFQFQLDLETIDRSLAKLRCGKCQVQVE